MDIDTLPVLPGSKARLRQLCDSGANSAVSAPGELAEFSFTTPITEKVVGNHS